MTHDFGKTVMEWENQDLFTVQIWRLLSLGCNRHLSDISQPPPWGLIILPYARVLTIRQMKIHTSKPHVFVPAFRNRKPVLNRLKISSPHHGLSKIMVYPVKVLDGRVPQ